MSKAKYTLEEKQKAVNVYLEVCNAQEASKLTGYSPDCIKKFAKTLNVKLPKRVYKKPDLETKIKRSQNLSQVRKSQYLAQTEEQKQLQKTQLRSKFEEWIKNPDNYKKMYAKAGSARRLAVLSQKGFDTFESLLLSEADGYKIHNSYEGTWSFLKLECPKQHIFEMRANNFQQGQRCPTCSAGRHESKGQREIREYIQSLGFYVIINDNNTIDKELDIYVPYHKMAIEFNGLLWHSEMASYKFDTDFKPFAHFDKLKLCQKAGIQLFAIFEDEWKHKKQLIKEMIKYRLKCSTAPQIRASDCEVIRIDKNVDMGSFFNTYHLAGHVQAMYAYALTYQGKIVACMSVRKEMKGVFEIARFAVNYNFQVMGAFSKLIKYMPRPIISYSDNRLSSGNVYQKNGFKLVKHTDPSYWYTDGYKRAYRTKGKRINDPDILIHYKTEREQALGGIFSPNMFGHDKPVYRIYDYGNIKWILD